mgnify:CR=1 FL=1
MYKQKKWKNTELEKKTHLLCRTNKKENNDVEIIISGDGAEDIAAELRLTLQKVRRKRELSYYIAIRK